MCSVEGCDGPVYCRGWCKRHWYRWRRYGDPLARRIPNAERVCSVDTCALPVYARGWCKRHHMQLWKALRVCSIPMCEEPHRSRGWCNKHYFRWRTHGDPLTVELILGDTERRFWSKVDKNGPPPASRTLAAGKGPCWLWTGGLNSYGYGKFWLDGRDAGAHRFSFQLHGGQFLIPGMELDHLCRVRHCVNPDHLEQVTPAENQRRGHDARRVESAA